MSWFSMPARAYKSAWNRTAAEHVIREYDSIDQANKGIAEMAALGYEPAGVSRVGDIAQTGAFEVSGALGGTLGFNAASRSGRGKVTIIFGFSREVLEYHEMRREREGREFLECLRKYLRVETDRAALEGIKDDLAPEFRVICEQRLADLNAAATRRRSRRLFKSAPRLRGERKVGGGSHTYLG
jgi:hypothetical protein